MGPTPDDIEAIAVRARAEAEAAAVRARAEIDALTTRATADADAAAVHARAEIEAAALRRDAEADRQAARALLTELRRRSQELTSPSSDVRRAERETLDRLLATRADLHDAIERLTEMTEPVLDLTDGGMELAEATELGDPDLVPLATALDDRNARNGSAGVAPGGSVASELDAVEALMRSAIGRAVDSAATRASDAPGGTEQPARRREQLRDGRNVL